MQGKTMVRLLVAVMLTLVSIIGFATAQEENLLSNAGFEDGFSDSVATSWQSWISSSSDAPAFQTAPEYLAGSTADDRGLIQQIRSGSESQAMFSFFSTHDAGIYQQVSGVTSGSELRFSIYAHVFSNGGTEVDQSATPGGVTIRVGIDPNGGTNPFAESVVYTEPFITYDTFVQYSTIATAENSTVTVFVRSTVSEPVENTIIFFDDAVLNVTPESTVPDEEPDETEEPVETEETPEEDPQSSDPTPTREGDTGNEETEEPTTEEPDTEEPATEEPETEEPATEEPATEEPTTEEPEEEDTPSAPISDTFPGQIIHTVQRGDTVGRLASRYGSSTQAIIDANGLNDSALIFVGQGLVIPVRIVPATETPSATPVVVVVTATPSTDTTNGEGGVVSGNTYIVQRGDNLNAIASRFNTTVGAIVQLNGIANPNRILVGQVLTIPGTGGAVEPVATTAPADDADTDAEDEEQDSTGIIPPNSDGDDSADGSSSYVVQPGDNLFRIALRNGVTLADLAEANNISNLNVIFVGQELTIP